MGSGVLRWSMDPTMTLTATLGLVVTLAVAQVHRTVPERYTAPRGHPTSHSSSMRVLLEHMFEKDAHFCR